MDLEIYCPHCRWEPDGKAHWRCSCTHVWDTFATGGICPRCHHRWRDTWCPPAPGGCGRPAPHLDWYHDPGGLVEELVEAALPAERP